MRNHVRNHKQNQETEAAKKTIVAASLLTETPFKAAFKATLGFYLAQFVATIAGLGILFCLLVLGGFLLSLLSGG
jgi:hypothetical protein